MCPKFSQSEVCPNSQALQHPPNRTEDVPQIILVTNFKIINNLIPDWIVVSFVFVIDNVLTSVIRNWKEIRIINKKYASQMTSSAKNTYR